MLTSLRQTERQFHEDWSSNLGGDKDHRYTKATLNEALFIKHKFTTVASRCYKDPPILERNPNNQMILYDRTPG